MHHFTQNQTIPAGDTHAHALPRMSTGVKLAASFTAVLVAVLAFVARGCVAEVVSTSSFHHFSAPGNLHPASQHANLPVIQFDPEEETLTQDGTATLENVAKAMQADPSATLHLGAAPAGSGAQANRGGLASLRAQTVTQFLASRGVNRARLSGAGFQSAGAMRPTGLVGGDATRNDRGRVEYSVR